MNASDQRMKLVSDSNDKLPGIIIGFSEKFWNNLLVGLIPQIFKELEQTVFINGTNVLNISDMMSIYFTIEKYEIINLSYDLNNTRVDLFEANNTAGIHVKNSSFIGYANYEVDVDPPILTDNGTFTVNYTNFDVDLIFQIGNSGDPDDHRYINVVTSNLSINSTDMNFGLNNTNNFNSMLSHILYTIEPPILNIISRAFSDYFEDGINAALGLVPNPIEFGNLTFDISFLTVAKITEQYTLNELVGAFSPKEVDVPFSNNITMPKWDPEGQSLQIYVSEFVFKSLFFSLYDLGLIDLTIDKSPSEKLLKFDTTSFAYFLPSLLKYFDKDLPTRLTLVAVDTYPQINMGPQGLNIVGEFKLGMEVFDDKQWKLAVLTRLHANFVGIIKIYGNLRMSASISKVEFRLDEVIETNIGTINIEMLRRLASTIETIIVLSVNSIFNSFFGGFNLNNFLPFPIDLGQVDFQLKNGFFTLQSTPELQSEANQESLGKYVRKYIFGRDQNSTHPNNNQSGVSFLDSLKNSFLNEMDTTDFKELFGRHRISGVKSAYKGYKFFESVLNLPNPDYDHERFSDL
jgi:hypothetical protein